jgi:hypothetical protein
MLLTLWMALASADQCAYVSNEQALNALDQLLHDRAWLAYCEPCGDEAPTLGAIGVAEARLVGDGPFQQLSIDGVAVDLAYTYVRSPSDSTKYLNMAALVHCDTVQVSKTVRWPRDDGPVQDTWLGHYASAGATLTIVSTGVPNQVAVELQRRESSGAQATLSGPVDRTMRPPLLPTPFGRCSLALAQDGEAMVVRPTASCGGVLLSLGGRYPRQSPTPGAPGPHAP